MMKTSQKLRFGPYSTPVFEFGDVVFDEVRGEVKIVQLSDSKIPWPIGKRGRGTSPVVYADLANAIRREANVAVCYWWGITPQTVTKWRKALDVGRITDGTQAVFNEHLTPAKVAEMHRLLKKTYTDPERNEKIRQSKIGKPRSAKLMEKLRELSRGRKWTDQQRQRAREARKLKYPHNYRRWTDEEDDMVRTQSVAMVMMLTGRSRHRVELRRVELGVEKRPYVKKSSK